MTLDEYLKHHKKSCELATELGVQPSVVSQWRRGVRPIPFERIIDIEGATGGLVGRKDLRPADWHKHWPELVSDVEHSKQAINE